jgi:hypothetical protein
MDQDSSKPLQRPGSLQRSGSRASTWRSWSPFDPLANYERSLHNYPWLTIDEDEEHDPLQTEEFRDYIPSAPPSLRRTRRYPSLRIVDEASEQTCHEETSSQRQPDLERGGSNKVEPETLLNLREPDPNLVYTHTPLFRPDRPADPLTRTSPGDLGRRRRPCQPTYVNPVLFIALFILSWESNLLPRHCPYYSERLPSR